MYFINGIEELTQANVLRIISLYNMNILPQLEKYETYYKGEQTEQVAVNYCYNIVQNYSGYLTGIPISLTANEDISDILEILRYNDYHREDNELLTNALIYGVAYELHYLDEYAQQRFTTLDSKECIPIYSNDMARNLLAVVRSYSANDIYDDTKKFADIYTSTSIAHYEYRYGSLKLLSEEPHYYGQVPVVVFELNKDRASVFKQVMSLQDTYNELLNANVNDYSAFVDAYMVIKGMVADEETLETAKKQRALMLPDDDADVSYLTKPDNSSGIKDLLDRIEERIERIAQAPDFSEDAFGTSSGIAIRFKLLGLENACANIEANMREALQKRLQLICAIQRLTATEFVWRDINIVFTRNLPINELEQAQLANQLRGLVSDKTLLSLFSFVPDVDKEMEQLEEQNKLIENYDFSLGDDVSE